VRALVVLLMLATLVACAAKSPAQLGRSAASSSASIPHSSVPTPLSPTSAPPSRSTGITSAPATAQFDHIVVVVEENHSESQIVGNPDAPFLASLYRNGLALANSYAVAHPSEPNYLALFAGDTLGVASDACPLQFSGPNLASELIAANHSFAGYSEDLPAVGSGVCQAGSYARKHNPWADFPALPASVNQPFTAFRPDYTQLPTVAFVVPNLQHDMHDGTVAEADTWLRQNIGPYAAWCRSHRSLLVITFDEDDGATANQIPTVLVGAGITPGVSRQQATHYTLLRTIEDQYGLSHLGQTSAASPLVLG
jgi:acid phosphatase